MKFGLSSLKNDTLTSEGAKWFSQKLQFFKSGQSNEKNEVQLGFVVKLLELPIFKLCFLQGNQGV